MQKILIQHDSDSGQRLDRFCKKFLPNAALGGIYKMLRTGKIKVNGKKKDQTYKIDIGDEITFWFSDEEMQSLQSVQIQEKDPHIEHSPSKLEILYEDESLLVINKSPWINVHAWDHKTKESNLIDQVQDYLQGRYDALTFRPALVHRIDRDTSGCILIAKQKWVLESLLHDLQTHKIEKIYHACVFGIPHPPQWTLRHKLLRIENAKSEAKVRVDPELWQTAVTHYTTLKTKGFSQTDDLALSSHQRDKIDCSLLECRIETGRTHQIRVHLAHMWTPIVWDKAYGDKKKNSYLARSEWVTHQMLHARRIVFTHPIEKKRITIDAPYPSDWIF